MAYRMWYQFWTSVFQHILVPMLWRVGGGWANLVWNEQNCFPPMFSQTLPPSHFWFSFVCHRSVNENENWQKKNSEFMAVSNGQGLPTTLLYCKGMLDKYLNWELTGTQIHKYAAHKYCQCKDFAKLSLTTAVFRQRDMCKETFRMFNIQMSHQSEFKKEWQKERAI